MQLTTTQYIDSLFHHLEESSRDESKASDSAILFTKALLSVDLNYTATSISRLDKLLAELSKKYTIEQLLSAQGGTRFFLLVAGYIGRYVAKQTGLPLVWHDYKETEAWRERTHPSEIQSSNKSPNPTVSESFPKTFAFSLSATIGNDFVCMPLMGLQNSMLKQATISGFIAELQSAIYDEIPINPAQEANELCKELLSMVSTGKLTNPKLEFYDFLKEVRFDYSLDSLQQLDDVLLQIKIHIKKQNQSYEKLLDNSAFHRFVFFLGFYVGMTSAKLANTSTRWMNHAQAQSLTTKKFPFCLEHASIQAFGAQFRTPLLMISNRLFDLTADYPNSAVIYAKEVMQENAGNLNKYDFIEEAVFNRNEQSEKLPELWQMAMEKAGFLLSNNLVTLLKGGYLDDYIIPSVYEYDELNDVHYILSYDSEDSVELAYKNLADNPKNSPFIVVIYKSYADLPTGRMDGLVIEIRGFANLDKVDFDEPSSIGNLSNIADNLVLQFVLPYRKVSHDVGFAIYPLVNSQTIAKPQVQILANALYKGAIEYKSLFINDHLWADYYLNDFEPSQLTPLYKKETQLDKSSIIELEIEVFPVQKPAQDKVNLQNPKNNAQNSEENRAQPEKSVNQSKKSQDTNHKSFSSNQYNNIAVKFW